VHHSIEHRAAGVEEIPNATRVPVSRLDRDLDPATSASATIASTSVARYGRRSSATPTPRSPVRPVRNVRAAAFGTHSSAAIAARTRRTTSGRVCGSMLTTRETVFTDTPASAATSRIVVATAIA
jgi:hypothetical protein